MNLNQLNYFITLAHMEHYTRAAEVLSITQPSLSHAISSLEEELGTYLFEKKGRNVILTKYGKVFLEYVENSLDILNAGIKKTKSLTSATSGIIDLGYIYTLGAEFIPRLLRDFLNQNPDKNIHFNLTVGNTTEILKGLKEEKHDLVFCSRKSDLKDIEYLPITEEELVLVTPKTHPLATLKSIDLRQTAPYQHIIFTPNSGLRPMIDTLYQKAGFTPKIAYEIEEDSAAAGMAAEGFGIAILPNIPILRLLNVSTIPITKPHYKRYIYMATEKNKFLPPITKLFIQYLRDHYKLQPEQENVYTEPELK